MSRKKSTYSLVSTDIYCKWYVVPRAGKDGRTYLALVPKNGTVGKGVFPNKEEALEALSQAEFIWPASKFKIERNSAV